MAGSATDPRETIDAACSGRPRCGSPVFNVSLEGFDASPLAGTHWNIEGKGIYQWSAYSFDCARTETERLFAIDRWASDTGELVPVTATVDLSALRHNVRVLQDRTDGADLMAVVKADAYGHGAIPISRVLHDEGIRHFAVARPAEGIRLRDAGLTDRILVLGPPSPEQVPVYMKHDLDVTVSSAASAAAVLQHARSSHPIRVHVKIDTGMGRIGVTPDEAPALVTQLADAAGVSLVGLWTHFATADEPESAFAQTQLARFESVLEELDVSVDHVHTANTGALLTLGAQANAFSGPLVRTGIALYGLTATPDLRERIDLRPVMRLRARVTQLKTISAGTPVSYGARWKASQPTRIATLGVGYGDGYPRLCSGRASVRLGGELCPVVGTICMDMCMVNLGPPDRSPASSVEIGDEATLFAVSPPTVYDVARWAETIPYEICCGISPRVPRRYRDGGDKNASAPISRASPSPREA